MRSKVDTRKERQMFNEVWGEISKEIGSTFKELDARGTAYIILNDEEEGIGTVEMIPYNYEEDSYVEAYFPFSKVLNRSKYDEKIHIVAKLGIKKDFRRQGYFQELIEAITEFSIRNNVNYFIANLNKDVYKVLRFIYKLNMDLIGNEFNQTETVIMCPVVINMKESFEKNQKQKWVIDLLSTVSNK